MAELRQVARIDESGGSWSFACEKCGGHKHVCLDTRMGGSGTYRRRRLACKACKHRFSTIERLESWVPPQPKPEVFTAEEAERLRAFFVLLEDIVDLKTFREARRG